MRQLLPFALILALTTPVFAQSLETQLKEAVQAKNWTEAIEIIDRMLPNASPQQQAELQAYQAQLLQLVATANTTVHTLNGTMTLGRPFLGTERGRPCRGSDSHSRINEGTSVVIRDRNNTIIAKSELQAGKMVELQTGYLVCQFPFEVTGLPDQDFYEVEVSGGGGQSTFSKEELEESRWSVEFVKGSRHRGLLNP
ncbi:MAG: hypothetical protein HC921_15110 [Synechococcaceae cyanobacterium SM2_3_1]|nr:hypothetical protein [Synechococcaceae cyanobacterium SM2_3_1]